MILLAALLLATISTAAGTANASVANLSTNAAHTSLPYMGCTQIAHVAQVGMTLYSLLALTSLSVNVTIAASSVNQVSSPGTQPSSEQAPVPEVKDREAAHNDCLTQHSPYYCYHLLDPQSSVPREATTTDCASYLYRTIRIRELLRTQMQTAVSRVRQLVINELNYFHSYEDDEAYSPYRDLKVNMDVSLKTAESDPTWHGTQSLISIDTPREEVETSRSTSRR